MLLAWLCSTLSIMAQGTGGYNPTNPGDPGNPATMLSYHVRVASNIEGAGTVTGSGYYKYGMNATLRATANDGYRFLYWVKNGSAEAYKTAASFSYNVVAEDVSFTAVFEKVNRVFLRINDTKAGTTSYTKHKNVIGGSASTPQVGTGSSSDCTLPFGNYYRYSTTQSIYTAEELGGGGTIKSIAYQVAAAASYSCTVNIYMGHKASSSFSGTGNALTASDLTLVYSKTGTIGSIRGWETYTLDNPFVYNGTDNLVVVVTKSASSFTNSLKYAYTSASGKCLYRQSDDTPSYASVNTTGNYSTTDQRPNAKFEMDAYIYGDDDYASINTTPNENYEFQHWLRNEETEPFSTEQSFEYLLTEDVTFTAIYKYIEPPYRPTNPADPGDVDGMIKYNLKVSLSREDAGVVSKGGKYKHGTKVTISTTPNEGYEFRSWTRKVGETVEENYSTDRSFSYTTTKEDVEFVAEYVKTSEEQLKGHTLTIKASTDGLCDFDRESETLVLEDDAFYVTVTLKSDVVFEGWYMDGVYVSDALTYGTYMPNHDVELVAKVRYQPYSPNDPGNDLGYVDIAPEIPTGLIGDVNQDGKVDVSDAVDLLEFYLKGETSELDMFICDVDRNSVIDVSDAVEILEIYINGK